MCLGETKVKKNTRWWIPNVFQVKRDIGDNYAERNAPFIFWCVEKIWGNVQNYKTTNEAEVNKTPNKESGLYIFYLDDGKIQYPIYVGITGRNFRQRFNEHYTNGVIHEYVNGNFPTNVPPIRLPLKVMCIPISHQMQAKLMESVFLATFDFCLNKEENGNVRTILDTEKQFPADASKTDFDNIFDNVMKEITQFYNEYKKH